MKMIRGGGVRDDGEMTAAEIDAFNDNVEREEARISSELAEIVRRLAQPMMPAYGEMKVEEAARILGLTRRETANIVPVLQFIDGPRVLRGDVLRSLIERWRRPLLYLRHADRAGAATSSSSPARRGRFQRVRPCRRVPPVRYE
ncbi:MAG: hypothetical protein ACO1OB_21160 [Archangium sp.]